MDTAAIIEAESRELIRRRGLDVQADQLEPLIREVVADYDRRSSSGEVPVLHDDDSTVAEVAARIGGFGPLQEMLDDPSVEEIWLNSPSQVFCARNGRSELTTIVLSDTEVRGIVERMLVSSGRRLDMSTPFVDSLLPDGSRLHVVIPSVTRAHWAINIRKFVAKAYDLGGLVSLGSLTTQSADFLDAAIASGLNVMVSGATGAGKTTFLRCLAQSVGARERVVTIEEVFELDLGLRDVVAMQTRQANLEGTGEISMRRLVNARSCKRYGCHRDGSVVRQALPAVLRHEHEGLAAGPRVRDRPPRHGRHPTRRAHRGRREHGDTDCSERRTGALLDPRHARGRRRVTGPGLDGTRVSDLDLYFAHQKTVQTIHGVTIRYRLALIGPTVTVVHSEIDETLPEHSVRIATGDAELIVDSASWIDRREELDAHVLAWLLQHIDLRAARPRPGARRYDELWMNAWREANPGRR